MSYEAIVVGAGPNGLVAANYLADAGMSVLVLETQNEPGGAVKSSEATVPGFTHDLYSAFYPLGVASPALRPLELERWGVKWRSAEAPVAHPVVDGPTALLHRDLERTCESLDQFAPGDGDAWRRLYELWLEVGDDFMEMLLNPFPPVRPAARFARILGPRRLAEFARFGLLPLRRLADETFSGAGGGRLLAGNALHADLTPDSAGGSLFGWLLCCLGQQHGFPVPEGGAGQLTDALVRRLEAAGGEIRCSSEVIRIGVIGGRASHVELEGGEQIKVSRAVLADVGAPALYFKLLDAPLPARLERDLKRFQYDNSTVKLDWALSAPIPWTSTDAALAGTIHVGETIDELSRHTNQLSTGTMPDRPFLVLGQYASFDPTRQPEGAETAWAYTHVPQKVKRDAGGNLTGTWDEHETEVFAARIEDQIERLAPGFRDKVIARHVMTPPLLEAANQNLVGGAINGGTAQIHQQLIFRPTLGMARSETFVENVYLASASAHPGGGVHGGPGANAAKAVLSRLGRAKRLLTHGLPGR